MALFSLPGCMDDRRTNYSIGQQFVTTDNRRCFCGNGESISCDQIESESSELRVLTYSERLVSSRNKILCFL